jgi:hypothetical protein
LECAGRAGRATVRGEHRAGRDSRRCRAFYRAGRRSPGPGVSRGDEKNGGSRRRTQEGGLRKFPRVRRAFLRLDQRIRAPRRAVSARGTKRAPRAAPLAAAVRRYTRRGDAEFRSAIQRCVDARRARPRAAGDSSRSSVRFGGRLGPVRGTEAAARPRRRAVVPPWQCGCSRTRRCRAIPRRHDGSRAGRSRPRAAAPREEEAR